MFLQIHSLTAYPASLLNRDDAGLAKRIPFGNAIRLRVSSQCLKRHWRESLVDLDSAVPTSKIVEMDDGYRSRRIFELILSELRSQGIPENKATIAAQCVKNLALKKGKDKSAEENEESELRIKQPIFLARSEVQYLIDIAKRIIAHYSDLNSALKLSEPIAENDKLRKEKKAFREAIGVDEANIEAMRKSARGFTSALFGRMVTSDLFARVDAPVHVAHAFTVHAANTEMDYFTVVDDLNRDDETGAAHANETELGAGVYYGYVVVDVPLLVSNLTGCKRDEWRNEDAATARRVLSALIESITQQSPGAKLGSTAPYAWADWVLLEAGTAQPRTLANAFLDAVPWKGAPGDLRLIAAERLASYLQSLDAMYGKPPGYRGLSTSLDPMPTALPEKTALPDNIKSALAEIWS
jgi:CRISPR system Cascade subunit CasC